ncbi:MAG: hypothetical protein CMQ37_11425 [Gammaproteobacteria bacterium]|nr:hypothetical protein [Gammaproteobacteria bacterium]|tara:strand:+ start:3564 stop:4103 length:540 start_codon:yes stop_codon:yes gene_type:complete
MKSQLIGLFVVLIPQTLFSQTATTELSFDQKYTLTIPFIGFEGEPGKFLNATLRSEESELSWSLVSVDEGQLINTVDALEIIKTTERPVQVFLKVSGWISSCVEVGAYAVDKEDSAFKVFVYFDPESLSPPEISCTADSVVFSKTIPLPVFELAAGDYKVSVNNKVNGSFSLDLDNRLP